MPKPNLHPKTLGDAIKLAVCIGPLSELEARSYRIIEEFLAQKFAISYLEMAGDESALRILEKLFEAVTRRNDKRK